MKLIFLNIYFRFLHDWKLKLRPNSVVIFIGESKQSSEALLHHSLSDSINALFLGFSENGINRKKETKRTGQINY